MGLDIDRLSALTVERVADFWLELRTGYLDRNRQQTSISAKASMVNQFLITLLDQRLLCVKGEMSRAQLRFGLRDDSTFGLRMATRIYQWRKMMMTNRHEMLYKFCAVKDDVLPQEQWTPGRWSIAIASVKL